MDVTPDKVVLSYNWLPAAKTLVAKIRGDPSSAWLLEMGDSAFGTLETQLEVAWKEQASHVVEELKKLETPRQQAQALSIPGFIVHLYRPDVAAAWFRVLLGETCEHLQRDISAKYHQVGYLNNQKGLKRADFASRCIEDTSIQHGNDGCFTRCPGGYGVMKALDTNFLSIELSSSMVTDHFLSGYISCLVDNEEEVVTIEVLLLVTNCTLVLEFES